MSKDKEEGEELLGFSLEKFQSGMKAVEDEADPRPGRESFDA